MATIAVTMIVRNEEALLGTCLASLHGFDEIVIIDTGSIDGTPDVIKTFEDKPEYNIKYIFGQYQWKDDFADARNFAINNATADWCFVLDADEYLEDGGIDKIRTSVQDTSVRVFDILVEAHGTGQRHKQPRLFRREKDIFWLGAIHNYLNIRGQQTLNIKVFYRHSPAHANDPDRSLRILLSELNKKPNLKREKFYLAREYLYRKQFNLAIEWYLKYLEIATWEPEKADALYRLASCYKSIGKWSKARQTCFQAIGINPDFKKALQLMASLSYPNNQKKWNRFADVALNEDVLFT